MLSQHGYLITLTLLPYFSFGQKLPQTISPGSLMQVPAPTVALYTGPSYIGDTLLNYVRTWTAQQPYTSESALLAVTAPSGVQHATVYFDGFGRPIETVSWQMSGTGNDLVAPQVYDAFGRQAYSFLPYEASSNTGLFQSTPFSSQDTFYSSIYPSDIPGYKGEQVFYGQSQFEASPLNRPLVVSAPGNSWAGSGLGVQTQYLINDTSDKVPIWTITFNAPSDGNNIPATTSNYAPGTLYKTVTVDERGSLAVEYKDLEGQIVEKKVQAANTTSGAYTGWLVTMYVYDDLNQLRVVIPPKAVDQLISASWTMNLSILDGLCFRYEYDYRKRLLGKKIPGAGWGWMVYDKRDQLVFSQDANMGAKSEWIGMLHDALDRPVMTGMMNYTGTQAQLQAYVDSVTLNPTSGSRTDTIKGVSGVVPKLTVSVRQIGDTAYHADSLILFASGFVSEPGANFVATLTPGASSSSVSTTTFMGNPIPSGVTFIPLIENFYDDYSWGTAKSYNTAHNNQLDYGTNAYADALPSSASLLTRDLTTGTRVRVLEDSANLALGGWLETASFYDDKGRVIQTVSDNYKGGGDTLTQRFDFTGKVVSSYDSHSNPQASTWLRLKTNNNYDGRGRLSNQSHEINDNSITQRTVAQYAYSRMGQIKTKLVGQRNASSSLPMEAQAFDYNIRGWIKGINRGFANPSLGITGGGTWWGMDLSYDWGFDSTALNGNIAGIRWRSGSNGEQRAYGFTYDRSNRLLYADFNQLFNTTWSKSDPNNSDAGLNIDYSTWLGDGKTFDSAYDDNGNILKMYQKGLLVNQSQIIDNLSYNYGSGPTNQLQSVTDSVAANDHLGDFYDGHTGANDYNYDANGNLLWDLNKGINWVTYDHLNLPYKVAVNPTTGAKGTITYIYDASGNRLEKRIVEQPDSADGQQTTYTNTDYIGGFVYQNNVLQFVNHEEGRIRPYMNPSGQVRTDTLLYDYFLKDHLGDTRMVLTEEQRDDAYPMASMETGDSSLENTYYTGLDQTRIAISTISGYPTDNTTSPNQYVSGVGGASSSLHLGPSITLRVMAQDTLSIRVSSWYNQAGHPASYLPIPVSNLVSALSAGLQAVSYAGPEGTAVLPVTGLLQPDAQAFIDSEKVPTPTAPKAYLSWIFFDDQFRFVAQGSYARQVLPNSGSVNPIDTTGIIANKSGFVYIYVSNADSLTTVYFDNLQVTQVRGPLTEEEHYYPFGLTMAGISSRALQFGKDNRYKFNKGSELEEKNFADGSGLEWYDTHFRELDPQVGRWWQIDPKPNASESPYTAMGNNPIFVNDPLGDTLIGYNAKSAQQLKAIAQNSFKDHAKVQALFKLSKDGKTFQSISDKSFAAATKGLSKDDFALATSYKEAINGKGNEVVDMVTRSQKLGSDLSSLVSDGATKDLTGADIDKAGSLTMQTSQNNTLSVIVTDSKSQTEYVDPSSGQYVSRIPTTGELVAHEVLGHAMGDISGSPNADNRDAIQMSNLYLRTQGVSLYRNGVDHGGILSQSAATGIPAMYQAAISAAIRAQLSH
jgi:RHS repeat-associated protein